MLAKAEKAFREGEYEVAQRICNEVIGETQDGITVARARYLLSQISKELVIKSSDYKQCVVYNLEKAIDKDPSNPLYRLELAKSLRKNNLEFCAAYFFDEVDFVFHT